MPLDELIRSRVHRILKKLPQYHSLVEQDVEISVELREQLCHPSEELLGIYQNSANDPYENIYFSNLGIYIYTDTWLFIDYGQIQDVTVPPGETNNKRSASHLIIKLESEAQRTINIKGIRENTSDVWEVSRFLQRVRDDVKKMKARQ